MACCRWLLRETTVSSPSALFPLWASPLFPFSLKVSGCRPAVGGCFAKPPSAALQPLFPYGLPLCFWKQPTRSLKVARESGVAYRLRLIYRHALTDAPTNVSQSLLRSSRHHGFVTWDFGIVSRCSTIPKSHSTSPCILLPLR